MTKKPFGQFTARSLSRRRLSGEHWRVAPVREGRYGINPQMQICSAAKRDSKMFEEYQRLTQERRRQLHLRCSVATKSITVKW